MEASLQYLPGNARVLYTKWLMYDDHLKTAHFSNSESVCTLYSNMFSVIEGVGHLVV